MTQHNTFEQNTKELKIFPVGRGQDVIELGATSWEKRATNNLEGFAEPSVTEGESQYRAQNMNKIEANHIFTALISDEFILASDVISSEFVTKEDVEEEMDRFFRLNRRIRAQYGHIDVVGYITEYNVTEEAQNDNSVFRMDFTILDAIPMSGGDTSP